jgi:hypothetical protein
MEKRRVVLAIALAAAIFVIGYDRLRQTKSSSADEPTAALSTSETAELSTAMNETAAGTSSETSAAASAQDTLSAAPGEATMSEASKPVKPVVPVAKLIPSTAKVRSQVEKDPHTTPEAVVSFSLGLGERLDQLKSEDEARGFMKELDSCVTGQVQETVTSARTLCLLNAKKVARKYPSLESEYTNLEGRADPNVKSALELMQ